MRDLSPEYLVLGGAELYDSFPLAQFNVSDH